MKTREICLSVEDFPRVATIYHFRKMIDILSREPYTIYHLHLYLVFNANILGVKVDPFIIENTPDQMVTSAAGIPGAAGPIRIGSFEEYEQVKSEFARRRIELTEATRNERDRLVTDILTTINIMQ